MTADAAVKGIRSLDPTGSIGVITNEPHPPYNRPPLSKALWKGEPLETVWRKTPMDGVTIYISKTAKSLDVKSKTVVDDRGEKYSYHKLLLATGVAVRRGPWSADGIMYFRTLDDYRQLRALTERGQSFAVIGGGFIGSEIAAALAINNKRVTMIFPEEGIGARVYPSRLSAFLNSYYTAKGVQVLAKEGVAGIQKEGERYTIKTTSGKEFAVEGVVAGIGVSPNVELAQRAGLTIENGVKVDELLKTNNPDIYAAGDVASFYNPSLEKYIRVEHEDNANTMGDRAGKNMAGDAIPYHHLPFFYSDLFDLGYEAVGELDPRLETVEDWKDEFREGVVYYLDRGRVRGVLLWNTWGQVDNARALIADRRTFTAENVRGLIPA